MNWLHYIGEANLYLAVFYLAYRIFLAKETYNQLNRAYLLFSCVAAFILPVLQLGILKPAEPIATYSYTVAPVGFESVPAIAQQAAPVGIEHQPTWQDYLIYAYAIGCCVLLLVLLVKLFTLIKLIHNAKRAQHDSYKLIYLPQTDVAFSFFNYLFIGTDANGANTIIRHELVHINQKHSLDILFLEMLKIINWFNPFIYLLQNSLKTIHEYIADEQTAAHEADPIAYSTFLVNNAYGAGGSSITHSFFNYNLLKKRIIMLNQQRSGSLARLKYLIAAPLCAGLLCASTLAFSKDYGFIDLDPAKPVAKVETIPVISPVQTPTQTQAKHQAVKFPPPPPPMVVNDHYAGFAHYLSKMLLYSPSKNIRDGIALVSFSITDDHKMADIKITKSIGPVRDAALLKAMASYKFDITDKPGKNYMARFYYFKDDYSIFKNKDFPANYKLDVLAEVWPRTYSATSKGFEYDLDRTMTVTKQTHTWHVNAVTIFGKNGDVEKFEPATADANMLKERYGFVWPVYTAVNNIKSAPAKTTVVKFPPPVTAESAQIKTTSTPTSVDSAIKPDRSQFYKYMADNIRFPTADRVDSISGRVMVEFAVNDKNELQFFWAINSPSNEMTEEVFRTIKNNPALTAVKGLYLLPVRFSIKKTNTTDGVSIEDKGRTFHPFKFNPYSYAPKGHVELLNGIVIRTYLSKS